MSGEDEIIPYAYNNFDPNDYDSFDSWFQSVNQDFESNGRNPLDQILDPFGMDSMKEVFEASKERSLSNRDIQKIIDVNRRSLN